MAQLVALMSGLVLGGVAEVVGSNLARGKIFTASIGSVDSLYPSVYIYIYNPVPFCSIFRTHAHDEDHKLMELNDTSILNISALILFGKIAMYRLVTLVH